MNLTLHFQATGLVPGNARPCELMGGSMSLGRGAENDLVLPDPDKVVSKRHCVIEDHGGNFVVVDVSTNGTFLNYAKVALGNTPTPISNGDILVMGPFELLVEISAAPAEIIPAPVASSTSHIPEFDDLLGDASDGRDFLDDLLGEGETPAGPASVQREVLGDDGLLPPLGDGDGLLDPLPPEAEPQGASQSQHNPSVSDQMLTPRPATQLIPDDWGDDFLSEEPAPSEPAPAPVAAPIPEATLTPQTKPSPPAQTSEAAQSFLTALGIEPEKIDAEELTPTFTRLGGVLKTMITGLREILMTRASIKSEFRIEQTIISAGANNPLKFSISPEQAIEAMVKPSTKGYLDAADATRQALDDIKAHEVAMMTGMEAALKGVLAKLDPKELEGRIETSGGIGSLLKGKKARYWEVYEQMYAQISDQAENDFHELFAREFAKAYQDQLERLK